MKIHFGAAASLLVGLFSFTANSSPAARCWYSIPVPQQFIGRGANAPVAVRGDVVWTGWSIDDRIRLSKRTPGGDWKTAGDMVVAASIESDPVISVFSNGDPLAAFVAEAATGEFSIHVVTLRAGKWSYLGAPLVVAGEEEHRIHDLTLLMNSNDQVLLAWEQMGEPENRILAAEWSAGAWRMLGSPGTSGSQGGDPSLTFGADKMPLVVWLSSTREHQHDEIRAARLSDRGWVAIVSKSTSNEVPGGVVSAVRVLEGFEQRPIIEVEWRRRSKFISIKLFVLEAKAWKTLEGPPGAFEQVVGSAAFAARGGVPTIAWVEQQETAVIRVANFKNGKWQIDLPPLETRTRMKKLTIVSTKDGDDLAIFAFGEVRDGLTLEILRFSQSFCQ